MNRARKIRLRGGISAAVVCAALGIALAAPNTGLALGGAPKADSAVSVIASGSFASFTPASVDPRLAKLIAERGNDAAAARMMRFTPAGAANRPGRSVTVAVRIDDRVARAISVRSAINAVQGKPGLGSMMLITPARYDLGMARDYRSFAQPLLPPVELRKLDMPDLSTFKPGKSEAAGKPSRFSAHIEMEEKGNAGRAPRTLDAVTGQRLDVGGSYRLTRNLDVTAGVRYSQERDRLGPLTDGTQDSQAVYLGTQFRF